MQGGGSCAGAGCRHSRNNRRARKMPSLRSLRFLSLLAVAVLSEPAPGRVPKVYNALITSNQNLEPSKAYPVYQPVIHDAAFAFPYSPVFYGGEIPLNSFPPAPAPRPTESSSPIQPSPTNSEPTDIKPDEKQPEPSQSPPAPAPSESDDKKPTEAPPLPPNTESPIPLNQFGLPSQVFPLNRFNPAFDGFTQVGPFAYSYPGFRFYDPYDPFAFSPYANLPPLYRPLTNVLIPGIPQPPAPSGAPPKSPEPQKPDSAEPANQSSPPPEPSDLNILNYSSKDPAIPNVVPPIPSGGLKADKSE